MYVRVGLVRVEYSGTCAVALCAEGDSAAFYFPTVHADWFAAGEF